MIAPIFDTPYYAVIFTSTLSEDIEGYDEMANRMVDSVQDQEGFLGIDSAREGVGITVCYWSSLEAIQNWKKKEDHLAAQKEGKARWYSSYKVRISRVERNYEL